MKRTVKTTKMVTCEKCQIETDVSEMYSCFDKKTGTTSYDCVDNKKCCQRVRDVEKKKEDEDKKERDKYKHLPREDQLKERYGVSFEDLDELPERYRDASIHYQHKTTGVTYSWSFGGNYWYFR